MTVLIVASAVENKKFGLGAPIRDVPDLGLFEKLFGFLGHVARVPAVVLACDRIHDVTDHAQRRDACERVHDGSVGVRDDHHVAVLNRLPPPNGRSVEAGTLGEDRIRQFFNRNREVLPGAGEVHELQVDHDDFVFLCKI